MAQIRLLTWNIEVYGPEKYGNAPNNDRLAALIAQVVVQTNANVFTVMELMSSVAEQICYTLAEAITAATGNNWAYQGSTARPAGDREAYGVLYETGAGANFDVVVDGGGQSAIALSTVEFPNNFSASNGRRAVVATFRTTDTANNFSISVYHAPPNARAIQGLEALARTPALYQVDNAGAAQAVASRLLGGDYNLDVNAQPEYSWLTDPVPAAPPPAAAGEGAGTVAITAQQTHLTSMSEAVATWGGVLAAWPVTSPPYRNAQYDNIFYVSANAAPAVAGGVFDLVAELMNPASPVRAAAQNFTIVNAATAQPAFPFAFSAPLPLNVNLTHAPVAWLIARYGVSDHLPVVTTITI